MGSWGINLSLSNMCVIIEIYFNNCMGELILKVHHAKVDQNLNIAKLMQNKVVLVTRRAILSHKHKSSHSCDYTEHKPSNPVLQLWSILLRSVRENFDSVLPPALQKKGVTECWLEAVCRTTGFCDMLMCYCLLSSNMLIMAIWEQKRHLRLAQRRGLEEVRSSTYT